MNFKVLSPASFDHSGIKDNCVNHSQGTLNMSVHYSKKNIYSVEKYSLELDSNLLLVL